MPNQKGGKNNPKKKKKVEEPTNNIGKKGQSKKAKQRVEKTGVVKKTGNQHADERRQGSARASENTANKVRQGFTAYTVKDITDTTLTATKGISKTLAKAPTSAVSGALKNSQNNAVYGNRGKSGQAHLVGNERAGHGTNLDEFNEGEKKRRENYETNKRENEKNGYAFGNSAIKTLDKTTNKIDKAYDKTVGKAIDKGIKKIKESKEKDLELAGENFSDEKKYRIPIISGMQEKEARTQIETQLDEQGYTWKDYGEPEARRNLDELGKQYGLSENDVLTNGMTWGEYYNQLLDEQKAEFITGRKEYIDNASQEAGLMSQQDIVKGGVQMGSEFLQYAIPYGGTTKLSLKTAEKVLSKTATRGGVKIAGKKIGKITADELSRETAKQMGKEITEDVVAKAVTKNGGKLNPEQIAELTKEINRKAKLKSISHNIKKELLANAGQDLTIGTAMDYAMAKKEGLSGDELLDYMTRSAIGNLAIGTPITAIAGRAGAKELKKTMANASADELNGAIKFSSKDASELMALDSKESKVGLTDAEITKKAELTTKASGTGGVEVNDKGVLVQRSSGDISDVLSQKEVKEYIDLNTRATSGARLSAENQGKLNALNVKVENARKVLDTNANNSLKGKVKAKNVDTLKQSVKYFERIGDSKKLKQAQKRLDEAVKLAKEKADSMVETAKVLTKKTGTEYKVSTSEDIKISALDDLAKRQEKLLAEPRTPEIEQQLREVNTMINDIANDNVFLKGYYAKGDDGKMQILINSESPQAHQAVAGHETGHLIKSMSEDDFWELGNMLEKYSKELGEFDTLEREFKTLYSELDEAGVKEELVSEMIGRYIFGEDDKFIKQLAGEKPSVAQQIADYIRKLLGKTTNKELREEFERILDSMPEKFATNPEIKASKVVSDEVEAISNAIKTEKVYNAYGWTISNKVLTHNEYGEFFELIRKYTDKVSKHIDDETGTPYNRVTTSGFERTADGLKIVPVGEKDGIKNVLVITDGEKNPTIHEVIRLSDKLGGRPDVETNISLLRSYIYGYEKEGYLEWDSIIRSTFGEGAFVRTTREGVPDYKTRKTEIFDERRTGQNGGQKVSGTGNGSTGVQDGERQGRYIRELKNKQYEVIQASNKMNDDYHTGIRSPEDILTYKEAISDEQWADSIRFTPDYDFAMANKAIKSGVIKVYSSKPIENGVFVSPSRRIAKDYAGRGNEVYSTTVPLEDVAWIDATEGQIAKVDDEIVISKLSKEKKPTEVGSFNDDVEKAFLEEAIRTITPNIKRATSKELDNFEEHVYDVLDAVKSGDNASKRELLSIADDVDPNMSITRHSYPEGWTKETWEKAYREAQDKDIPTLDDALKPEYLQSHKYRDQIPPLKSERVRVDSLEKVDTKTANSIVYEIEQHIKERRNKIDFEADEAVEREAYNKTVKDTATKDASFTIGDKTKQARYTNERIDMVIADKENQYIANIDPETFLDLTLPEKTRSRWRINSDRGVDSINYSKPLDETELRSETQTPYLTIDLDTGRVFGHEGRHRMLALSDDGVKSVPVIIRDANDKYAVPTEKISKLEATGQDFGSGATNGARVEISDLVPATEKFRNEIGSKFGGEAKVKFSKHKIFDADGKVTKEVDDAYMEAVNSGYEDLAQSYVDAIAEKKGFTYDAYHGSDAFGFTEFDMGKLDDGISIFASKDPKVAGSYTSNPNVKKISDHKNVVSDPEFDKLRAEYAKNKYDIFKQGEHNGHIQWWIKDKTTDEIVEGFSGEAYKTEKDAFNFLLENKADSGEVGIYELGKISNKYGLTELQSLVDKSARYDVEFDKFSKLVDDALDEHRGNVGEVVDKSGRAIDDDVVDRIYELADIIQGSRNYGGIYHAKLKISNPLEIDAKQSNWSFIDSAEVKASTEERKLVKRYDDFSSEYFNAYRKNGGKLDAEEFINSGESKIFKTFDELKEAGLVAEKFNAGGDKMTTREVAEYAKQNGHDGVVIKNVYDTGAYGGASQTSTVYIVFDSSQFKSADAITRDNNGNVIPLSERFNESKTDMRFSKVGKNSEAEIADLKEQRSKLVTERDAISPKTKVERDINKRKRLTQDIRNLDRKIKRRQNSIDADVREKAGVSSEDVTKMTSEALNKEAKYLGGRLKNGNTPEHQQARSARLKEVNDELKKRGDYQPSKQEQVDQLIKEKGYGWEKAKEYNDAIAKLRKKEATLKEKIKAGGEAKDVKKLSKQLDDVQKDIKSNTKKLYDTVEQSKSTFEEGKDILEQAKERGGGNTVKVNKATWKDLVKEEETTRLQDGFKTIRRLFEASLIDFETTAKDLIRSSNAEDRLLGRQLLDQTNSVYTARNRSAYMVEGKNGLNDAFKVEYNGKTVDLLTNDDMRKDFSDYLFYKHAIGNRHELNKDVFGDMYTQRDLTDLMGALENKYGKDTLEAFEKNVRGYIDKLNQYRLDAGLITKKQLEKLEDIYPYYVPTNRVGLEKVSNYEMPTGSANIDSGIKTATGSDKPLEELYLQLVKMTDRTVKSSEQNRMMNLYAKAKGFDVEALKKAKPEDIETTSIGAQEVTKGKWRVTFMQDGEKVTIPVNRHCAKGLREWNGQDFATLLNVCGKFSGVARPYKGLITDWNLIFGTRNGMRDQQQAIVNSADSRWYGKSLPRTFASIDPMLKSKDCPFRELYEANGGKWSSIAQYNNLEDLTKLNKNGLKKANEKTIGKVLDHIENINGAIELVPRLTEFIGTLQKEADILLKGEGSSIDELMSNVMRKCEADGLKGKALNEAVETQFANAVIDTLKSANMLDDVVRTAMRNSADITLNFSRSGVITKALNSGLFPYLNPSVQGLSKTMRLFTEGYNNGTLVNFLMKLSVCTVAPSVVNELLLAGNDEYQSLNTRDKDMNFFIPCGDGQFIKIPKPRENAVLSEPFAYATRWLLDSAQYGTMEEMKQMFVSAKDNIGVIDAGDFIFAPLVKNFVQNQNWYGGKILNNQELRNEENGEAYKNYDESTSWVAKKLGGLINMSPKRIDNVMDSYMGLVYDLGISQTSEKAKNDLSWKYNPVTVQFMKDSVFSNKYTTQFWDKADKLNNGAEGGKDTREYTEFMAKYGNDTFTYDQAISDIDTDKSIPKSVKADMKRELRRYKNALVRRGLEGKDVVHDPMQRIIDTYEKYGVKNPVDKALSTFAYGDHKDAYEYMKSTKEYRDATPKEKEELQNKFLKTYKGIKRIARNTGDQDSFINYSTVAYVCAKNGYTKGYIANCYCIKSKEYSVDKMIKRSQKYIDAGYTTKNFEATIRALNRGCDKLGDDDKRYASQLDDYDKAMILAEKGYRDGAYYIASPYLDSRMNAGRCLTDGHSNGKFKWTDKRINNFCNEYNIVHDKNYEWDTDYIVECINEKYGNKSMEEKASVYQVITGDTENFPFGEIGDYSHKNDTGLEDGKKSGGGRRGGHRGGGGGRGRKGSVPNTSSGAINGKITDPFKHTRNTSSASNLNDAYRKKVKKLREKTYS